MKTFKDYLNEKIQYVRMYPNDNSFDSVFVPKKDLKQTIDAEEMETVVAMSKKEYNKLSKDIQTAIKDKKYDYDEISNLIKSNDYIDTSGTDLITIPDKGKYIVVYSEDQYTEIGEDPYMWDHDYYCYTYWDGHNHKTLCSDDYDDVATVYSDKKKCKNFNYGRAVNYYVFKDGGEYVVASDNEGYYDPISEYATFNNKKAAIEFIKEEIGDCQ